MEAQDDEDIDIDEESEDFQKFTVKYKRLQTTEKMQWTGADIKILARLRNLRKESADNNKTVPTIIFYCLKENIDFNDLGFPKGTKSLLSFVMKPKEEQTEEEKERVEKKCTSTNTFKAVDYINIRRMVLTLFKKTPKFPKGLKRVRFLSKFFFYSSIFSFI